MNELILIPQHRGKQNRFRRLLNMSEPNLTTLRRRDRPKRNENQMQLTDETDELDLHYDASQRIIFEFVLDRQYLCSRRLQMNRVFDDVDGFSKFVESVPTTYCPCKKYLRSHRE